MTNKDDAAGDGGAKGVRAQSRARASLVAAYREGLGLAAIAVIHSREGIRISVSENGHEGALMESEAILARWWCRRSSSVERVAASAMARLRCRDAADRDLCPPIPVDPRSQDEMPRAASRACDAVKRAALQLNIRLHSEREIRDEALIVIERIDEQIEQMQRAGELKSVNKSYREYRTDAAAHGEKILRYCDWMDRYRASLVRQAAATLRFL